MLCYAMLCQSLGAVLRNVKKMKSLSISSAVSAGVGHDLVVEMMCEYGRCYAMLCCCVLCYAMLCYAMLCYASYD
jgi:hypothetical protein